jgi:hypothetical protein
VASRNALLNYSSTLKMEAIRSSETSGATQRTTRRHIPEDDTLHNHRCENLKSYIEVIIVKFDTGDLLKCIDTFQFWLKSDSNKDTLHSSVGIATGLTARVRFPAVHDFSLPHSVQTDSGAHPASYPMGTGALSPGVKRLGCEAGHSAPSSTEVKHGGAIPPLPHMSSWHSA